MKFFLNFEPFARNSYCKLDVATPDVLSILLLNSERASFFLVLLPTYIGIPTYLSYTYFNLDVFSPKTLHFEHWLILVTHGQFWAGF